MGLSGHLSPVGGLSGALSAEQGLHGTLGNLGATESLHATANGTYTARTGFNPVEVDVPLPVGEVNITANGVVDVYNYASANVNVPNPSTGTKQISENGTYNVTDFASADVNVQPPLQSKSVSPSETAQTVTPDSGKYGLSSVGVGAIPSDYVGSQIPRNPTPTASGKTVTTPSGYYSTQTTTDVANGSVAVPATALTSNPTINVNANGLITASHSASAQVSPTVVPGYVDSGTAGTYSTSGTASEQLPTQAAQTITPTTADQTIAAGKYLTGVQTIKGDASLVSANILANASIFGVPGNAMNKNTAITSGAAGSSDIRNGKKGWVNGSLITGDMTEKSAATYTPTRSQQIIAANQYLAGAQTIEPIPNEYIVPTGTLQISSNGTGIDVTQYAAVDVAVPGGLVHIATLPSQTVALVDTAYNTWSPSTTATAVIATDTAGTFTATDILNNDYFIRCRIVSHLVYAEGTATSKGRFAKVVAENWYTVTRRPSNNANLNSGTRNTGVAEGCTNLWASQYYNSGWIAAWSTSYGFYPANSAPTFSSATAASPTITVKRPIINARCSTTYFTTAMAGALDKNQSTFTFAWDVYRADSGYMRRPIYQSLIDMWSNGLT